MALPSSYFSISTFPSASTSYVKVLTGFEIQIDFGRSVVNNLIATDSFFFSDQLSVLRIHHQSIITFRPKTDMINTSLSEGGILNLYISLIQIYGITIGVIFSKS